MSLNEIATGTTRAAATAMFRGLLLLLLPCVTPLVGATLTGRVVDSKTGGWQDG